MALKRRSKSLEDQPAASSSEEEKDSEEDFEEVREEGVIDEGKQVVEVEEEDQDVMEEEEEDEEEKLFIVPMLPSNMRKFQGTEGLTLIETSKAKELEQKWKKLKIAETKLYLERLKLINEHVTMMLDALNSSSS